MDTSKRQALTTGRNYASATLHSILRLAVGLCALLLTPFILMPRFLRLWEEFGIAMPRLTQLLLALSDKAIKCGLLYIAPTLILLIGIEIMALALPKNRIRLVFNLLVWSVLTALVLFIVVAIAAPMAVIR